MTNAYHLGQKVRISAAFTVAGAPTDPTAVIVKTRDPAGIIVTKVFGQDGDVIQDSPGNYHLDFVVDREGGWTYRWESGGTAQAARENALHGLPSAFQ